MSLSRVETKKKTENHKKSHSSNRKRLLLINVALLAIIIIVVTIFTKGETIVQSVKNSVSSLFEQTNVTDSHKTDTNELEVINGGSTEETGQESNEGNAEYDLLPKEPSVVTDAETDVQQQTEQVEATVSLAFVGDILQGEYINTLLKENGYNYPYEKALFSLSSADYTMGNLEMPITKNGVPMHPDDKEYVFKGEPEALSGLVYGGIDIVTLANNHTLDQGLEALYDTMQHLDEHGIHHVGAGKNEKEAYEPHIVEINGIKIGYLAASWVLPINEWKATPYQGGLAETYDAKRILSAIENTKQEVDIVVLYVHWGEERNSSPLQKHIDMAKKYIDAGADLIVGSHAHVLQGFEQYNGKWIAYNLGNFVFSAYPSERQAETGVLNATCNKEANCELSFVPMKTIIGQPTPLEGDGREELLDHLEAISLNGVKIDSDGTIKKTN